MAIAEPDRGWTVPRVAAAIFFVGFLSVQLLVPALVRSDSRPARFGWRMYSTAPLEVQVTAVLRDGSRRPIEPRDHLPGLRADVDFASSLAPYLCRTLGDAARIEVRIGDRSRESKSCR
jgi:hypothetical protein